jgi:hypothetical protein
MSASGPKGTYPFNRFLTQTMPKGGRYAGDAAQRKGNGTMFTPLIIAFFVFAIILAGAFAGAVARRYVPQHHLSEETKSVVSISMAVVATISALVLGLLLSNANSSFSAVQGQVNAMSAQILRLDQLLRRYGSETKLAREKLREYAERKRDDLFPNNPADIRLSDQSTYDLLQEVEDLVLSVKPADARDQWWLAQAMTLASKIGDTRFLLAQHSGRGTPQAVLLLLVFWLTLLFASFALFAPSNMITNATLTLCALAIAGSIGMILELERGFGGLVQVSPQAMNHAVSALQAEANNENSGSHT